MSHADGTKALEIDGGLTGPAAVDTVLLQGPTIGAASSYYIDANGSHTIAVRGDLCSFGLTQRDTAGTLKLSISSNTANVGSNYNISVDSFQVASLDATAKILLISGASCQLIVTSGTWSMATSGNVTHSGSSGLTYNLNSSSGKFQILATQVVGPRITGWAAATNTKSKATFDTTTVTLPNLAARVGQLIDDLMTHGLIGT